MLEKEHDSVALPSNNNLTNTIPVHMFTCDYNSKYVLPISQDTDLETGMPVAVMLYTIPSYFHTVRHVC
jgi:hypothetical protein